MILFPILFSNSVHFPFYKYKIIKYHQTLRDSFNPFQILLELNLDNHPFILIFQSLFSLNSNMILIECMFILNNYRHLLYNIHNQNIQSNNFYQQINLNLTKFNEFNTKCFLKELFKFNYIIDNLLSLLLIDM